MSSKSENKTTPQSQASIFSLLSLPNELLLQILSHTTYPSLFTIQRTHPHFRNLITKPLIHEHLLRAETSLPSHFASQNRYICFTCLRVLPSSRFSDKSRKTPKGHAGKQAHKRFCIQCGLRDNRYQPGQAVVLNDVPGVICHVCKLVFCDENNRRPGRAEEEGFCQGHDERKVVEGASGGAEGDEEWRVSSRVEASKEALWSLAAGRIARKERQRRRRGRSDFGLWGIDDMFWEEDNMSASGFTEEDGMSESEFTEDDLWDAWGYDKEF